MKLALGTVQMGMKYGIANYSDRVTTKECSAILQTGLSGGMDTLDTAIAYGQSEAVLGQLGVRDWKIITKLPAVPLDCINVNEWVNNQIQSSLYRLGVTQLYGVLLHRPSQLNESFGVALYAALEGVKAQGLARKIGVSVSGPAELDLLFNNYSFDILQAPLNILDRRLIDSGWAKQLHSADVEIHTRSTFLQGLLTLSADRRPAKFNRWIDTWNTWDRWLAKEGLGPVQACLQYVANLPVIDRIVVGVDNAMQLNQVFNEYRGNLSSLPEFNILNDDRLIKPESWVQL